MASRKDYTLVLTLFPATYGVNQLEARIAGVRYHCQRSFEENELEYKEHGTSCLCILQLN